MNKNSNPIFFRLRYGISSGMIAGIIGGGLLGLCAAIITLIFDNSVSQGDFSLSTLYYLVPFTVIGLIVGIVVGGICGAIISIVTTNSSKDAKFIGLRVGFFIGIAYPLIIFVLPEGSLFIEKLLFLLCGALIGAISGNYGGKLFTVHSSSL